MYIFGPFVAFQSKILQFVKLEKMSLIGISRNLTCPDSRIPEGFPLFRPETIASRCSRDDGLSVPTATLFQMTEFCLGIDGFVKCVQLGRQLPQTTQVYSEGSMQWRVIVRQQVAEQTDGKHCHQTVRQLQFKGFRIDEQNSEESNVAVQFQKQPPATDN